MGFDFKSELKLLRFWMKKWQTEIVNNDRNNYIQFCVVNNNSILSNNIRRWQGGELQLETTIEILQMQNVFLLRNDIINNIYIYNIDNYIFIKMTSK